jgi:hypothetical protein
MDFAAAVYWQMEWKYLLKQEFLIQYEHHNIDRCPDTMITVVCEMHGYLCSVLDNQSATLRKKYGEIKAEDFDVAESALKNLYYLWTTTNLGKTPKYG